ncbi:MAG: SDR family oxidoreductase [Cyclobacteriaceae bacterium]|nr:SDR family oxidoreductase [Cyclobacteriaceae bacterium]
MSKNFLFAGASSAIAQQTGPLLQQEGHRVLAISTKPLTDGYDQSFLIERYSQGSFPVIEEPLDGLVYFPGTINLKPFNRLTPADFTRDYEINALGAALFIQQYLPNLKKTESASIVLISSVAASLGLPFHGSISMAKAALEGLTKALAAEFAPSIRVNCIAPSMVDTPLASKFVDTPEKRDQLAKRNPLRKIGTPADVANMISFLLRDQSQWMTGQVLGVDGGMAALKN